MRGINRCFFRKFAAVFLAAFLGIALAGALPDSSFAEGAEAQEDVSLQGIWVVPEVISGARQPAKGGMFAWVTFDYNYGGGGLQDALDPADFTLQMQAPGQEWTDFPGERIAVLGGEDYYIASFEAIVAARIPENQDAFIKKWRVVYKADSAEERLESEIIVQAACLDKTDDLTAFDHDYCIRYKVEKAPWSYEEYQNDSIPPIYIAYVNPDSVVTLRDPGLTKAEQHQIVLPWMYGGAWDMKESGVSFEYEYFGQMETGLYLGTADEDEEAGAGDNDKSDGIAALVRYWEDLQDMGMWSGAENLPKAEDLQRRIASLACVPDENADEYLTYIVEGSSVFWVSGAGTQEQMQEGVQDYILVVVRDYEAPMATEHVWGQPEWKWTGSDEDGYTAAAATFTCANNSAHTRKADAVIRCREDGDDTVYTAIVTFNGEDYTDTRIVKAGQESEEEKDPEPKTVTKVTINQKTISAKTVKAAMKAAGAKSASVKTFVLGAKVRKISRNAFKGTKAGTLVIKGKNLTKKSVKGSLSGSRVKTIRVSVGKKSVNSKYIKKYRKIFTKGNAGRKVSVK